MVQCQTCFKSLTMQESYRHMQTHTCMYMHVHARTHTHLHVAASVSVAQDLVNTDAVLLSALTSCITSSGTAPPVVR